VAGGTPTASIAGTTGATSLTATGVLGTSNKQTLQIGTPSTGNINISQSGATTTINGTTVLSSLTPTAGIVHNSANGTLSSSLVNLTNATDVTGILPVANGGSPFEQNNGAINERITTQDFLLGGTSTGSAKFAF